LRVFSKEVYPHLTAIVINKTYEIPLLVVGNRCDRTSDISMNQLQPLRCSP
jgi:hypothetical protein